MPDLYAISQAIAARYAAGQVTPPAGYGNIRTATANPPNAMPAQPAVIVFPDSGDFDHLVNAGSRLSTLRFLVRFYYAQGGAADIPRSAVALQKWVTVLADQLRTSVQLGGTVTGWARVDSYVIGAMTYAGKDYHGAELIVNVEHSEGWAAAA